MEPEEDDSGEMTEILQLVDSIFQNLDVVVEAEDIAFVQSEEFYLQILEIIFSEHAQEFEEFKEEFENKPPAENIQKLIDFLSQSIMGVDLNHINGQEIVNGNRQHILNLLQLIHELATLKNGGYRESGNEEEEEMENIAVDGAQNNLYYSQEPPNEEEGVADEGGFAEIEEASQESSHNTNEVAGKSKGRISSSKKGNSPGNDGLNKRSNSAQENKRPNLIGGFELDEENEEDENDNQKPMNEMQHEEEGEEEEEEHNGIGENEEEEEEEHGGIGEEQEEDGQNEELENEEGDYNEYNEVGEGHHEEEEYQEEMRGPVDFHQKAKESYEKDQKANDLANANSLRETKKKKGTGVKAKSKKKKTTKALGNQNATAGVDLAKTKKNQTRLRPETAKVGSKRPKEEKHSEEYEERKSVSRSNVEEERKKTSSRKTSHASRNEEELLSVDISRVIDDPEILRQFLEAEIRTKKRRLAEKLHVPLQNNDEKTLEFLLRNKNEYRSYLHDYIRQYHVVFPF